jgi:hypothetical protein
MTGIYVRFAGDGDAQKLKRRDEKDGEDGLCNWRHRLKVDKDEAKTREAYCPVASRRRRRPRLRRNMIGDG